MLQQQDAIAAVQAELGKLEPLPEGDECVVYPELTRDFASVWVVFYGSRRFKDTGSAEYAVAGNAPFIVDRQSGAVVPTGTAQPTEHYVAEYMVNGNKRPA
jgi:hypothetical protein